MSVERLGCGFRRGVVRSKFRSGRISKRCRTGRTAPSLNLALTVGSKSFATLVLASEADHLISPLAFCGETSQNICGSEAWVTPRFGLAPPTVAAGSGALIKRDGLRWNNGYFHRWTVGSEADGNHDLHCVLPFSHRAVLVTLRGS